MTRLSLRSWTFGCSVFVLSAAALACGVREEKELRAPASELAQGLSNAPAPIDCTSDPTDAQGRFLCLESTGLYGDVGTVPYADRLDAMRNDLPLGTADGVTPYEPQYPLWSDGLCKSRWLYLPPGTSVDASDVNWWAFPNGAKLWKEFSLAFQPGVKGRRVETRLIQKTNDPRAAASWTYAVYIWTEDQQQALLWNGQRTTLDGSAETITATVTGRPLASDPSSQNLPHVVPSQTDCRQCHEKGGASEDVVLGFDYIQLSANIDPNAPNRPSRSLVGSPLFLDDLLQRQLVTPAQLDAQLATAPVIQPEARSAIGYFHANCGGCHNARRGTAGLNLRFDALIATPADQPAWVNTVGAPTYSGGGTLVAPGQRDQSEVYRRMGALDGRPRRMPYLGSQVVDPRGLDRVGLWIDSL